MDDRLDVVGLENFPQTLRVPDVALIKRKIPARQLLNPPQGLGLGVVIIIEHHDVEAGFQHFNAGVAADIAAAACNQYGHLGSSLL